MYFFYYLCTEFIRYNCNLALNDIIKDLFYKVYRMQKEGYTVFTGPLKNESKNKAVRLAEKSGNLVVVKKIDSNNKNTLDGKYIAKIMNDE
jgi:hypothetical protein